MPEAARKLITDAGLFRCSRCKRPFHIPTSTISDVERRGIAEALLNEHKCDEDAKQAAFRVIKESTESQ